jgi:hypothetical protein
MSNFFWPERFLEAPDIVARLGRAVHWLSIPAALLLICMGLSRPMHEWLTTEIWGAVSAYLIGRLLRYLLAGE